MGSLRKRHITGHPTPIDSGAPRADGYHRATVGVQAARTAERPGYGLAVCGEGSAI